MNIELAMMNMLLNIQAEVSAIRDYLITESVNPKDGAMLLEAHMKRVKMHQISIAAQLKNENMGNIDDLLNGAFE